MSSGSIHPVQPPGRDPPRARTVRQRGSGQGRVHSRDSGLPSRRLCRRGAGSGDPPTATPIRQRTIRWSSSPLLGRDHRDGLDLGVPVTLVELGGGLGQLLCGVDGEDPKHRFDASTPDLHDIRHKIEVDPLIRRHPDGTEMRVGQGDLPPVTEPQRQRRRGKTRCPATGSQAHRWVQETREHTHIAGIGRLC